METLTSLLTTVDERVSRGQDALMLHAGSVTFTPRWKVEYACDMGGWYEDIHGTVMAPVTTDWNALKPYVYLDVFLPEDRNDPQYGYIYAGKGEHHIDKGQSIVAHTYSGSPGKTNVWRSIVNRAEPHEIYKHIVSVYDSILECRIAEKRLIVHLWDRFGRVDEGGIVTNLTIDVFCDNYTPEESRARSEHRKGKSRGSFGRAIFIREADGTEHDLGNLTEAVDLVVSLYGWDRERALAVINSGLQGNVEVLKPHGPTGMVACYATHKHLPNHITHHNRLIRLEDEDGVVEEITAHEFWDRFAVTRHQTNMAIVNFRNKDRLFMGKYAVTWADGELRSKKPRPPVFDRLTGERYDRASLVESGFEARGAYRSAESNQRTPYVACHSKPVGETSDFFKTYFVFEEDLEKPITPPLLETPTALLENGRVNGADVFASGSLAARSLGLDSSPVTKCAKTNSARIASGRLPIRWATSGGTHVAVYLHDLPTYCELTGQEMPFSLMPYVADIAKWQAENPRANSKASKSAKA